MIPQTRILKLDLVYLKGANLAGGALVGSATAIGAQEDDKDLIQKL